MGLSPQTVWKKQIHEALATPWKAFARSPLGLASILGQAADQPPFRRPKRSRHRPPSHCTNRSIGRGGHIAAQDEGLAAEFDRTQSASTDLLIRRLATDPIRITKVFERQQERGVTPEVD